MKKPFVLLILSLLLVLFGCADESIEFPTYNEVHKVEMTETEINTLLDTIDLEAEIEKVFGISMQIDMEYEQQFSNVAKVDFNVSILSEGFIKLGNTKEDLELYLDNAITMRKDVTNLVDKGLIDKTKLSGMVHAYFMSQQLYMAYDFDTEIDGKYKLSEQGNLDLGDELLSNFNTIIDQYLATHTSQEKLINFLLESDMIYTYEKDGIQTLFFDIDSHKIKLNKDKFIDPLNYAELQYHNARTVFIDEITKGSSFQISISLDIIDDKLDTINISYKTDVYGGDVETHYDVVIILKTGEIMPAFPSDLEQYESVDQFHDITI